MLFHENSLIGKSTISKDSQKLQTLKKVQCGQRSCRSVCACVCVHVCASVSLWLKGERKEERERKRRVLCPEKVDNEFKRQDDTFYEQNSGCCRGLGIVQLNFCADTLNPALQKKSAVPPVHIPLAAQMPSHRICLNSSFRWCKNSQLHYAKIHQNTGDAVWWITWKKTIHKSFALTTV